MNNYTTRRTIIGYIIVEHTTPKSVNYNLECITNKMDGLLARIISFCE
jgi:hypothetical protein